MAIKISTTRFKVKVHKKRKGIHAKSKQSKNKHSKHYFKVNIGQG